MYGDGLERTHAPHHAFFRASHAGNAKPNRPAIGNLIEMAGRTGGVGDRTLTAHLIETPPFAVPFVAECGGKTAASKCARRGNFRGSPARRQTSGGRTRQRGQFAMVTYSKTVASRL